MIGERDSLIDAHTIAMAIKTNGETDKLILEGQEEVVRTMTNQYKFTKKLIKGLEQLSKGPRAEATSDFDFVDIDKLKEEQAALFESMQALSKIVIPRLRGIYSNKPNKGTAK